MENKSIKQAIYPMSQVIPSHGNQLLVTDETVNRNNWAVKRKTQRTIRSQQKWHHSDKDRN